MSKRRGSDDPTSRPSKRQRQNATPQGDYLSTLSDEILLEILSFLPINSLVVCQRLSKRFHGLAGDSELWKQKYYARWVLPRSLRALQLKHSKSTSGNVYVPRISKWPGHDHLATADNRPHWKTQYRLRHNWSKGTCTFGVLEVSRPPLPQILMKLYSGVVVTADKEHGLRAWSTRASKKQLTALSFLSADDKPTALFMARGSSKSSIEVTVGFEDGHFDLYDLNVTLAKFVLRFSQVPSTTGSSITSIASSHPYILTISQHRVFSLYKLQHQTIRQKQNTIVTPSLLASLESNNMFSPMSLSLRCLASEVIASIAYSFFHISSGWTVGIQELRFNQDGERIGSRLASTVAFQPEENNRTGPIDALTFDTRDTGNALIASPHSHSIQYPEAPTSLSYSHPYLLTSHNDNTLTMYLVASSSEKLSIRAGRRLWGHTSSVSSVQVGDRGKAVSISPRGNEIRIWELETAVSPRFNPCPSMKGESSVRISSEKPTAEAAVSVETTSGAIHWGRDTVQTEPEAMLSTRAEGCVTFDEEQVVVLRERGCRAQLLECYDFT
ncbi:hypothetical protein BGW36DRAFT_404482 [Talaromyces proteolyticus]|uniref:Probable E3 ubiquitin ligase complex SCF subunit sconB n=1 Tax=Talaromyces proteolyticus TaxID=1131652 RepID=A0AAD4L660_9EURO|nr:uncharacterized protein BGW36DRAFT_404482 [Talaromyces proteolyticus]KAH8704277.1 hypothetical protein BGW36DRAFT_404482 [Talaromyces proteolyticus]